MIILSSVGTHRAVKPFRLSTLPCVSCRKILKNPEIFVFRASANTRLTFGQAQSHRRPFVHGLSTHSVHYHSRPVHDRTYSTEIPLQTAGNLPLPRKNIIICSHASNIITLPPYDCKGVIPDLQFFNIEFSALFRDFFVQHYKTVILLNKIRCFREYYPSASGSSITSTALISTTSIR